MKLPCLLLKRWARVSIRTHENCSDSLPGWIWMFPLPVLLKTIQCPSDNIQRSRLQQVTQVPSRKKGGGLFSLLCLWTTKKASSEKHGLVYDITSVGEQKCVHLRWAFLLLMKIKLGFTSYQSQGTVWRDSPPASCVRPVTVCIFLSSHKTQVLEKMVFHGCVNTVSVPQDDREGRRGVRIAQHFHLLSTFTWGSQLMFYLGHLHFFPMMPWEAKQMLAKSPQCPTVKVMKLSVSSNWNAAKSH